jgi:retron-type reverse transcriptase
MNDIGISGSVLTLFKSYLHNRKQLVKINDVISHELTINCGVPQGTTLSPVLFNIQLDNIKLLNLNSHLICYADDTALICIGNTWEEVFTNIETDLKTIII